MIDLHCHSTASDGMRSPGEVVRMAAEAGVSSLALTDHDTTAGLPEAQAAGDRLGVEVIGGCEFSVGVGWGEMHLLGYFIESGDETIEAFLSTQRAMREQRAESMLRKLHDLGITLDGTKMFSDADGATIGRPHVARALQQAGHAASVQAAFDKYIGRGRPAFVEKVLPPLRAVAELVHGRGGVLSAAHLKSRGTQATLKELQDAGLDAVEVRHPSHDGDRKAILTEAALALNLGRSGGSDWHGESEAAGTHATLGSQDVPDEWLTDLRARRPSPSHA